MPSLKMVGPTPTSPNALMTRKATDNIITGTATPTDLQAKIDAATASLVGKDYVDLADGNFTTKSYVDTQDGLYVPSSWRGAPNGVAEMVNGIVPNARVPKAPTFPIFHARTWRYTDFTSLNSSGAGSSELNILNATMNLSSNAFYCRFLAFGTFEGWQLNLGGNYNNLNGKPTFKVYIQSYLCAMSSGRNGNGSGASSPASVTPVPDDLGHTPGSGWSQATATVRVTLSSPFPNTAVQYAPTPQTLLTVFAIGI